MPESDPTPTQSTTGERAKAFARRLGNLIVDVRGRRLPLETEWLWNHAAWRGKRLEERAGYHSSTYNHYIAVARRAIERVTTRVVQMLLPAPIFFEVYPGSEYDLASGRGADAVRAYLTYLLMQRLKVRKFATQITRSLLIYQRAISKTTVQLLDVPVMSQGDVAGGRVRQVWPTMRAVDPFAFYVWPETVTDMDDAVLVFEDLMMPVAEYEQAAARGVALPIGREDLKAPEWPHYHIVRLAHTSMADPSAVRQAVADEPAGPTRQASAPQEMFVSLTEAWFKAEGRWMLAWLVWNVDEPPRLVRLQKSPYPSPPYREALARPLPGEHYTSSVMDDLEQMQQLFNDQVNQGEESRALSALPPVEVDITKHPRMELLVWGPMKKWPSTEGVGGIQPVELKDTSASAVRAAQITLALINSIGGAGGIQEGQPARGLPRAGFAVTSLINLGMADIKDVAELLEQEVFTPLLGDLYRLAVTFVPRGQLVRIPGSAQFPSPQAVTLDDLYGNWAFRWVGSQQAQDQQLRSQRLIVGAQMLAKVEPLMRQQGYMVNWPDLIKMIWRDGMGERGVEQIIVPVPPAQLGGGLTGGAAGGEAAPPAPGGQEDLDRSLAALMSGGMAQGG